MVVNACRKDSKEVDCDLATKMLPVGTKIARSEFISAPVHTRQVVIS